MTIFSEPLISKFRCNNIKLPIETGRWSNTPREERICHLCNVCLGTEFHFLFECTAADVQRLRCKFIPISYDRKKSCSGPGQFHYL
jgi:hypothetical protein